MGNVRTSDPDEAVGASLAHPDNLVCEHDKRTLGGTYGFTLWKQEQRSAQHYEGGTPVVRVALAYNLRPEEIESTVQEKHEAYSDLPMSREEVSVAEKRHSGVAVGPFPGSTPSTEVYVPVDHRVYQINVYGKDKLDTAAKEWLASLQFNSVSRSVDSLDLPDASVPETFYVEDDQDLVERERSVRAEARSKLSAEEVLEAAALPQFPESQIGEGCWRAASSFFFQTQHGMYANSRTGDGVPTGHTIVGRPNYWGEYTHGAYGYGRCVHSNRTNDMYAIDFPLAPGDYIFSPFKKARVTWAGWHPYYINYGLFVVTQAYDNAGTSPHRYWNMSAHLSALKRGIRPGVIVTDEDIIGYAGATGDPSIPVGEPHLHSAFYRYPHTNEGRPYGGQGLQVIYHHYVGTAAGTGPGIYTFGWNANSTTKAKGSLISN